MEVPRLGVKTELHLPAYANLPTYHLHHRLRQCSILNPLSKARDQSCILMDISRVLNPLNHNRKLPPDILSPSFSKRLSVESSKTQGSLSPKFFPSTQAPSWPMRRDIQSGLTPVLCGKLHSVPQKDETLWVVPPPSKAPLLSYFIFMHS